MNWLERICISGIIIGFVGFGYINIVKPAQEASRFQQSYHSALLKFADINYDGYVSVLEEGDFSSKLFSDFKLDHLGEIPRYLNGKFVPYEVLESRISDYEKND